MVNRTVACGHGALRHHHQDRRARCHRGLAEAGVCAFKLSTYEYDAVRFPRIDHPTMVAAFAEIAKTGLMVAVHNEDQEIWSA
jgi:dihydroorotase-like cyclic amidohydrolase